MYPTKEQFIKVANDYRYYRNTPRPVKAFSLICRDVQEQNPDVYSSDIVKIIFCYKKSALCDVNENNVQVLINKFNSIKSI